jgi:hypothetical protein
LKELEWYERVCVVAPFGVPRSTSRERRPMNVWAAVLVLALVLSISARRVAILATVRAAG